MSVVLDVSSETFPRLLTFSARALLAVAVRSETCLVSVTDSWIDTVESKSVTVHARDGAEMNLPMW